MDASQIAAWLCIHAHFDDGEVALEEMLFQADRVTELGQIIYSYLFSRGEQLFFQLPYWGIDVRATNFYVLWEQDGKVQAETLLPDAKLPADCPFWIVSLSPQQLEKRKGQSTPPGQARPDSIVSLLSNPGQSCDVIEAYPLSDSDLEIVLARQRRRYDSQGYVGLTTWLDLTLEEARTILSGSIDELDVARVQ